MAQTTEESSSNKAPIPMEAHYPRIDSLGVLSQSDKLFNKTALSFYLNKYGFKTPWKSGLEFRILELLGVRCWNVAAQEGSAPSLPSHSALHQGVLIHPLATLWTLGDVPGALFCPLVSGSGRHLPAQPWEWARGHLGKGFQDPEHRELSLEGIHF